MGSTQQEDERSFERGLFASIDHSPIATVITNPRLPDNPIVAANLAFCRLTGFAENEILGRNCRLLARPGEETPQRAQLRSAIEEGRPILVSLPNYRKDGTPFINAVMVAPVLLSNGTIGYFMGSQIEVADTSSDAARARDLVAALSKRQRQVLEGIVQGERNKQIAWRLDIQEKTVKMHRAALLKKLHARTSADAIRIALTANVLKE